MWDQILTILSLVLSLAGIYFAWRTIRDGKAQSEKLEQMLHEQRDQTSSQNTLLQKQGESQKALAGLANSLTTRFIGIHPGYISTVRDIVRSAKSSIFVMSTAPCFGYYVAPSEWEELKVALISRQLNDNIPVVLLSAKPESTRKWLLLNIGRAFESFDEWIDEGSNRADLVNFCKWNGLTIPESGQGAWLERALLEVNDKVRAETYKGDLVSGGAVELTNDFLPVIAWIADDRRAVFALTTEDGTFPGFYTEDRDIIQSLARFATRIINDIHSEEKAAAIKD